jgi:hypothetical protein
MSRLKTEDILQHAGVKGMKWGVRKSIDNVRTGAKAKSKNREAKRKEVADKYHNKHKDNSRYKKLYEKNSKIYNHTTAVLVSRKKIRRQKRIRAYQALTIALTVYSRATTPEAKALGRKMVSEYRDHTVLK